MRLSEAVEESEQHCGMGVFLNFLFDWHTGELFDFTSGSFGLGFGSVKTRLDARRGTT